MSHGDFRVQLKSWRVTLLILLDNICNQQTRVPKMAMCTDLTDVYQFGVYTGRSLKGMVHHGTFRPRVRAFWGFDSFSGMPDETLMADKKESKLAAAFPKGMFDVKTLLPKDANQTPAEAVASFVHDSRLTLLEGFYDVVLTNKLAKTHGMRPALYVDIDCDLYSSTITALRWMLKSNLIVPGTFVGYDDWKYGRDRSTKPGRTTESLMGEPRAHAEVTREFGLEWKSIHVGSSQMAFQLVSRRKNNPHSFAGRSG